MLCSFVKHGYIGVIFPLFCLIIHLLKGKFTDQMMKLHVSVKVFSRKENLSFYLKLHGIEFIFNQND